jgi:hypothetical protein
LATTTGAEGISASRIMLRSAACWVAEMARISSARPMARSRPVICSVEGTGRSRPADGGGAESGSSAPGLARRRALNSCCVISPWSRSARMVAKREITLASPPANLPMAGPVMGAAAPGAGTAGRGAGDTTAGGRPNRADVLGAAETLGATPPGPPLSAPGTPPLSSSDRLTLAIWDAGRVEMLFQTTNCTDSSGRMASTASYISRALVIWPVF